MRRKKLHMLLLGACLLCALLAFSSIVTPAYAAAPQATPQQWYQTGVLDGEASCLQGTTISRNADNQEDQTQYNSGWNDGFHAEHC